MQHFSRGCNQISKGENRGKARFRHNYKSIKIGDPRQIGHLEIGPQTFP